MRLLHVETKQIDEFQAPPYPPYAILSHTWGEDGDEVTFQEMMTKAASPGIDKSKGLATTRKPGYDKIERCCARARADDIEYVWIDTCCIDKTSSAELSEAINSMYGWYEGARICYAWLCDVPTADSVISPIDPEGPFDREGVFRRSRWLARGWTLQELVAARTVEFYAADWTEIGTKASLAVALASITGIDEAVLAGRRSVLSCNVAERMSWAADRSTKRVEDAAYSLLGLFGVAMPLIYGEGRTRSFYRLQEEILQTTEDYTILAWEIAPPSPPPGGIASVTGEAIQQRPRRILKTILPEAEKMGSDIDHQRVRGRPPLADSPAAFHVSRTDWREWRYSNLKSHFTGQDAPGTTRKDWAVLGTLAPDYSPPQLTARGLRTWLALHRCGPNIVLAHLNCTLNGRSVCTYLRRAGKPGTNIYERVVPFHGAYCFLPRESVHAFRVQLVYIASPGKYGTSGDGGIADLSPPPFFDSAQVEVQVQGPPNLECLAAGWNIDLPSDSASRLGIAQNSVEDTSNTRSMMTDNTHDGLYINFARENPTCVRAVYDHKYPFIVLLKPDWCEILFLFQERTKQTISKAGGNDICGKVDAALVKLGGQISYRRIWDAEGRDWDAGGVKTLRSVVSEVMASSSHISTGRRDRILRDSGNGFFVAVAYKRLGNRSVVRVTVAEMSTLSSA